MIERKCKVCASTFYTYPSRIEIGRGLYCNRKCSNSITLIKKGQRLSPATELKKGFTVPIEWKLQWKGRLVWNKGLAGMAVCKANEGSFKKGNHYSPDTEIKKGQFALDKHFNWKGGVSFNPYPLGWNDTHKEQIRYRDRYQCRLCGCPEVELKRKLHIHHINYEKKDLIVTNLISLCGSCHVKTNYNRDYWLSYFKEVMYEH